VADATKGTGEPVADPGAGELTVTPAKAAAVMRKSTATHVSQRFITEFNIFLLNSEEEYGLCFRGKLSSEGGD